MDGEPTPSFRNGFTPPLPVPWSQNQGGRGSSHSLMVPEPESPRISSQLLLIDRLWTPTSLKIKPIFNPKSITHACLVSTSCFDRLGMICLWSYQTFKPSKSLGTQYLLNVLHIRLFTTEVKFKSKLSCNCASSWRQTIN